jgi:hypothetical protein
MTTSLFLTLAFALLTTLLSLSPGLCSRSKRFDASDFFRSGFMAAYSSFHAAPILDLIQIAFGGLHFRDVDGIGGRLGFRGLTKIILAQGDASVEIVAELLFCHDLRLDGIKLVSLDAINQIPHLGMRVNAGIAVLDKTFQLRVLLLMDVYTWLEIPATLLAMKDGKLKLLLRKRCRIINIVGCKEVGEQALVSSTTISGFLRTRFHIGPDILLARHRGNDSPDLLFVDKVNRVGNSCSVGFSSIMGSPCNHLVLFGWTRRGRVLPNWDVLVLSNNLGQRDFTFSQDGTKVLLKYFHGL